MAFGARQENGIWRICERKGRTITHVCEERWPSIEVRFKGRADAERCAKELNENWWATYKKKRHETDDALVQWGMVRAVHKHNGITDQEYKEMTS